MKNTHKKKYEIEKQAKNRAYAFIISQGQLAKFQEFCNRTQEIKDTHEMCMALL